MTFNTATPVRTWNMETFDPEQHTDFWATINALPLGSVIATGFLDDGVVFFEKTAAGEWTVAQVDNPNVADVFPVGETTGGDSTVIDAGGDIEIAFVIREGK